MINIIKTEFLKERRSSNSKLKFIVPIIFILFNILMVSLMGSSDGRSLIMATAFNWYPIMILPIVLSLLVVNIVSKEKEEHIMFARSLNLSSGRILISKNIVVIFELFIILLISSVAVYFVGKFIFGDDIEIRMLTMATFCLFIGSLPVISISFLVCKLFNKKILIIIMNFVLTFAAVLIVTTNAWNFFPWVYNLRILSPVIGVHPNGTFLEATSPLMNMSTTYFGLVLSIIVYVLITALNLFIERKNYV